MATFSRGVAVSALTFALVAPSIVVPQGVAEDLSTAATTTETTTGAPTTTSPVSEPAVIDWNSRHAVTFTGDAPAVVEGFMLPAGSTITANTSTIFNWQVEANEDGSVALSRPSADLSFTEGEKDVAVTVTLPGGKEIKNTLKVTVAKRAEDAQGTDPDLARRYETENFWNEDTAAIKGLQVDPNYTFTPTANTIFNWNFVNDNGILKVKRPQSAAAFKKGDVSIPVKITRGDGSSYTSTLNLSVIDEMPKAEWENDLPDFGGVYDVDFEGNITKVIDDFDLPEGVSVEKKGLSPLGWGVATQGGKIQVTAPNNFIPGVFTIPVVFKDGKSEVERTLRISAKNPATPSGTIADKVADFIGKVGGGLLGGLTGGAGGGGLNILSNNGNPNIIITDNAKAEIKDNLSNNGNPVITNNFNPHDNGNNNGSPDIKISDNFNPVITDNAKVEIKDNANNNGSPDIKISDNVKISDNAKADIKDNVKISDNAKADIKDNANNNGNPDVKISDNANPKVDIKDNGNPDVKVSDNAKATVVITDNAKVDVKDNANNNGNPDVQVEGIPGSSGGSSKPGGQGGQGGPTVDANVGLKGGSSDPRCVATLIGVGLPLLAIIPLALSTQLATPGLGAVGNQLSRALTDAARAAGTTPEALAGIGGGVLGLFAAVVAIAGGANCIPNVDSAAVSLGSAKPAPVVPTETTEEATPTEEQ
ncbi:hypothetical protein QP866_01025 [Corynebacterium imitans]|uniref:hypothetical protein n=1 Tax=Corynebacterium imitans TaxID=156978 RepID=UPI002550B3F6|nr:hypothetical protein [Corynebacterium imitans]MDK8305285.1 hypothetical protein [Corynebacterium imitans]MDK8636414.1 hypothetical protein [Corynebacterium imitans]MDK8771612.1 hypothetical protein [Corynebacterium imitans]